MSSIIAFQIDPLHTLSLHGDSSLALAFDAQKRGNSIFTYQVDNLSYDQGKFTAKGEFIRLDDEGRSYTILESQSLNLENVTCLLVRQDPPFDQKYIANTYLLEHIEDRIKILNSPRGIRASCEKTIPLSCPDFIPPTLITSDSDAICAFSKEHDAIIIKPLFGHGGNGVLKLEKPSLFTLQTLLSLYGKASPEPLVVQKYLPEIIHGDKRILLINGNPVASFKRVPQAGDVRSNLAQGGSAKPYTLTNRDREICDYLKPLLIERGLYLVGIDVIGDYLMEVNVTSPTGLRAAKSLYNIDVAKLFWDGLNF